MNEPKNKITLFDNREVRQLWEDEAEKWWFSVVDVIAILSDQPSHERARKYWSVMKTRLKQEGAEPTTVCSQLKMQAHDGKMRLTDVADTALIKLNKPLWNTAVDGFGNHDPGRGRYEQAKPDWDVIHEGRTWANKCNGKHAEKNTIITNIRLHLEKLGPSQ